MKTLNTLYISLILLSIPLFSSDKLYSFIGIQTGSSFVEGNSIPSIGLKYGRQSKQYRTSLSYSYGEQSSTSYQTLIAQIDTGILTNTFKNTPFKPYAGFSFGAMQERNKLNSSIDRGYIYGLNTGVAYIFNDALDFDLGYRYLETSKLDSINSLSDLTLSMHYFY